ncbi:PKD domain-containing protein, partial [Candidatus Bathyarchaeota archaeon]|nr:PKD domain-containing protein [Candidatus Bathyarchaeota archaeon]
MNVFEVVTGTSSSDYSIFLDDVDFSWTPNDNAPTIERVEYVETAFNGTTMVNFTANYTDLDNNPPVFMNLSMNSTLYEMQQVVPNDQNYTDGCLYTCSLVFNDTGNLTYFFNGSDGTTAVSTSLFELEVIEEEPLYFDGMLYEWTGWFGWTGVREQGHDLFGETGSGTNIFHVDSDPSNSFSGNRDINGTTGVITSTSGMIWQPWIGARDWVKLPRDVGVGTSVTLGLVNGGEQTFTIQEQRYYPAAGIMYGCWYMTSVQGSHAYYDKFSGLLVNLSIVPPFPENNYTIQIHDTNVPRIENSNPVILSGVSVDPTSAPQDTEFTFNITCTDADEIPPASVDILIDGMPHPMIRVNESDDDASDGILYTCSTYLQLGTHDYSMVASDGIYWDQTTNASITVTSSNGNAPVLSGGSVSPLSGYNGTSRFRFWVEYTDADNNAPVYVNVSVNGTQHELQKAVQTDDNYMDGCSYERIIPFTIPGNYSYQFECSDGISLGSDGPHVGPVVNATNAAFFDGMVYKWDGYFKLFGSDELHYWGKEYFNQTNATHYQVLSTPMNWMGPMNRDVDGLTREVTNGFYPMNTIEWVKISTDISMGSSLPIAVISAFDAENFIVTGETLFTTNSGSFDCWILEAPSGHVAYYDKYSGMLVNGTYFTFMGGMEEFTLQFMDTNIPLRPNLHAPELENGLVVPASGNQSTAFTFSVNYTDADNDAPEFVHVEVNETIYAMTLQDPSDDNYTDGTNYRTIVYLEPGTYNYTFKCSDWVHVNSTSTYPGLVVTETNSQPPELTAGMVNPDYAFNGSTVVTFSVIYTDLDNNAPVYINVTLNSTVYNLSKENISDLDYMDGCLYSLSLILNDTGNYTYHFNASDGITAVGFGPFTNLEVEEKSILFFDGMIYNYTAYFSWTDTWDDVTENCVDMGSNLFNINSSLRSNLWGNRTVDGATRILTDDIFSDFMPGTHEWSRIFGDVGMGSNIPISTAWQPISRQFTVTGETIFFSMGYAFECWVLESSRGEIAYYDKYSSMLVNGTFLINMGPGSTEFYSFQVTGTNIPLKPNTGPPQLENGTVIPASGDQADLYNFTVLYSDPDDNAPFYVNVSINGSQHQMLPVSPELLNFKDGVLYSYTTYLSPGNYSYSFNTMDGLFSNTTILQAGPTVSETNVASPSLLNVAVTPELGSNITIFTFSVIYQDADNNLPVFIEIEVNGSSHAMAEVDPSDLNATDGKAYQYESTLVEGFHQFQVRCSDGINPAATPWIENPQVSPLFHFLNYTVFHEDFEGDLSQWDTISGFWHQTGINSSWPDSFHSVNQSAWFGRELFGSYANGSRAYGSLITKPIDLTAIPAAYLEFYHWRNAMVPDESLISISIDGINWDDIFSSISVVSPWEKIILNISQYCGNRSVRIRFMFDTIDGWDNNYRGWLVDDIKVYSNISSIVPLHPVDGGNVINGLFNFTWSSLDTTALPVNFSHELSSHENFSTLIVNDTNILETPINTSNLALLDLDIGSYFWRVGVQHGSFESYSGTFILIMPDRTPVADFTENSTTIYQGEFIEFTFNGTEGNLPMAYQWDFGDGSALGSGISPVHQYNSSGDFTVTLIVTDRDSDSDVKVKFLHIHVLVDLIPIVNFTVNESIILVNDQVQFNFTGSEGNLPALYQWNFNDSTPNATIKNPVHQFTTEGTYNITLTIQDANGDIATLKKVGMVTVVVDRFPEANFTANITTIYKGNSVQFNFTGTEGDAPATFQWNFTDG